MDDLAELFMWLNSESSSQVKRDFGERDGELGGSKGVDYWSKVVGSSDKGKPRRRGNGPARESPEAGEGLDKDLCVEDHENVRMLYLYQMALCPASVTASSIAREAESTAASSAPFSSLKVITIPELIVDKRHHGRVLYGQFCVIPFTIFSFNRLNTVLEDASGKSVRVTVCNVLGSEACFPLGMKVAIKEPCFKGYENGRTAVLVNNLADILLDARNVDDNSVPVSNDVTTVEELATIRSDGNRLFREHDWAGAVRRYSQCINQAVGKSGFKNVKDKTNQEKVNGILILAYSNRAEAKLRLQAYEDALRDADNALQLDPNHVKTLVRKGKAAYGLGLFEKSCKIFETALELSPEEESILNSLKTSTTAYKQSQTGDIDLTDYYARGCTGDAPVSADFVGPVVIRRVQYGSGRRGLFATRGVEKGKILMVSNPLVIARHGSKNLITDLAKRITASERQSTQLCSLLADHGKREIAIPPMGLFRPGSDWVPSDVGKLQLDIGCLSGIVRLNSFGYGVGRIILRKWIEKLDEEHFDATGEHYGGIWVLPSFLNHSCTPCCLAESVGDAIFVRAAQDIKEGDELTISYIGDLCTDVDDRQALFKNWSFTCKCERCLFEKYIKSQLSTIMKAYSRLVDKAHEDLEWDNHRWWRKRAPKELAALVSEVEAVFHSRCSEVERSKHEWIRAMFQEAYIAKYFLARKEQHKESSNSALKSIVDTLNSLSDPISANAIVEYHISSMDQERAYGLMYQRFLHFRSPRVS